eukprot:gb/GECH01009036.1/.p1 GENE.gb/GECH01009036.1/~~gb/GECH01009036.1/.p1  ORF type:complete len:350 (+),score=70.46 gb/GECH01009036.1/:1-1050(+)
MTSSSSPSSNPTLPTSTTSSMDSSRPPPHLSRYQRQRGDMHPVKNFIAGNSGGIVGVLVGHPLDTIRVRIQTQKSSSNRPYKGVFDCFTRTVYEEGWTGLYKGVAPPILAVGFQKAVSFTVNHQLKCLFGVESGKIKESGKHSDRVFDEDFKYVMLAGAMAGFANSLISCPVDQLKIRLQVQKHPDVASQFRQAWKRIREMYQEGSVFSHRGVYRGWSITAFRDVVGFLAYFPVYEATHMFLRNSIVSHDKHRNMTMPEKISVCGLSGGIAGCSTWVAMIPFDVIKSRLQSDRIDNPKYYNIKDCMIRSFKKEGMSVFFKGLRPALFRAFPVHCSIFITYEMVRWALNG